MVAGLGVELIVKYSVVVHSMAVCAFSWVVIFINGSLLATLEGMASISACLYYSFVLICVT